MWVFRAKERAPYAQKGCSGRYGAILRDGTHTQFAPPVSEAGPVGLPFGMAWYGRPFGIPTPYLGEEVAITRTLGLVWLSPP